ncbi:unnamed protein product [Alternaria alternata]
MISRRNHDDSGHHYVDPSLQLNIGLWTLFAGASLFLALRIWIKITRRHGLWWDDHILLISWVILAVNNSIITTEFATGYVADKWDDRMHILINITSCGTLINQSLTKSAFAVTLLKLTKNWGQWILWFIIGSMNAYMVAKVVLQWAKICEKPSYDVWYRLDFCLDGKFRDDFKEGGNVYNIIMDFILAVFPWVITWNLDMRRVEKVGLCVAMSLGMLVAVVSAKLASTAEGTQRRSRVPSLFGFGFGPGPTIGTKSTHKAHIYSNGRTTVDTKSEAYPDSWDTQGIYQKREFELTTMEVKAQKNQEMV